MARTTDDAVRLIQMEARAAQDRYGDLTSTHEALGVLVEEMEELTGAIRSNVMGFVRTEAKQVAAVAARLFHQASLACEGKDDAFLTRSGCSGRVWPTPK